MRLKAEAVFEFGLDDDQQQNKIVREYRREYKLIGEILDQHPKILEMVHRDLARLSKATSSRGRKADFTSENLFRAILVMQRESLDYREASIRIAESETLQNFCRLIKKRSIDFTLLNKGPSDSNRGPTDSSLLLDSYRVLAREMSRGRQIDALSCPWRFHLKKIKKMEFFVTRYFSSKSKQRLREVKRRMKELIVRVEKVLENAEAFVARAKHSTNLELMGIGELLAGYLPNMRKVAVAARRREFDGEKVPNSEKVFSIFEPHAELIMRGRRDRPVEFGHKVLLTQSKEKFITDYVVLEKNRGDDELLSEVLDRHEKKYGRRPETIAADKGFCPDSDTYEDLEEQVDFLGVPRRTRDLGGMMMGIWQRWRAGIEGTVSCLKRAFRLARCCFRGFKNFASAVGSAIFCHNLRILAKTSGG